MQNITHSKYPVLCFAVVLGMLYAFLSQGFFVSGSENPELIFRFSSVLFPHSAVEREITQILSPRIFPVYFDQNVPHPQPFSASHSQISHLQKKLEQREKIFRHLEQRAEEFRYSVPALGLDQFEVDSLLTEGWRQITSSPSLLPESTAHSNDNSEIVFLLEALDSLPDSEAVSRAMDFIRIGYGTNAVLEKYSVAEQFRNAAFQLTEKEEINWEQTQNDFSLLVNWKSDSMDFLLTMPQEAPLPSPIPEKQAPQNALGTVSSFSIVQNHFKAAAFPCVYSNWQDEISFIRRRCLSEISFFQKTHTLSAGRRDFLLI